MKHKKLIIITLAVIFFITAVTLYVNRVIFPKLVRKIAIEQAQHFLKRKVEIGNIRFSWVKGFIIDKVKVYQKDSTTDVLVQAEGITFGIIIIPGIKQHQITIPFVNVNHPSAHLIRTGPDAWNFSDLIPAPEAPKAAEEKPSPFSVILGAVNLIDGQLRVDDISLDKTWTELFDAINLKMSLSYKGINYDFTSSIPQRQGYLAAKGSYQPITQDLHTTLELKNIDTSPYLSLVTIPNLKIYSGLIKKVDLTIDYGKTGIAAQGNITINQINLNNSDQQIKGNVDITGLDAKWANGPIKAKGDFNLTNLDITTPAFSVSGHLKGKISDLTTTNDLINYEGSTTAESIYIKLSDKQIIKGQLSLDNIKIRKDKDGTQLVGALTGKSLDINWLNQTLKGDISLKPLTIHLRDENHLEVQCDLKADHLNATLDATKSFSGHVTAQDTQFTLTNKKDITLSTKLTIDEMAIALDQHINASANIKAKTVLLKIVDDILKLSTEATISNGSLTLDDNKTVNASPRIELDLTMPLKDPAAISYAGSITVSDAHVKGFPMTELIKNIEFDADFKTDAVTINALTVNILDTDLRANGSINHFKNPLISMTAEANDLNLARVKEVIPELIKQYGLEMNGVASVKMKFDGLALTPLAGKILAVASLKDVNVTSSAFNQTVKNITGVIEATPDTLKWRDFTATYLGQAYTLTGGLTDFKNPKIITSLDGAQVQLKADIAKDADLISINTLKGKYLNISFDTTGTVTLDGNQQMLDLKNKTDFKIEDLINFLPEDQQKAILPLKPTGNMTITTEIKGPATDWKNWTLNATANSPSVSLMNYTLTDLSISVIESDQQVKNLTLNASLYGGKVHAVASTDLSVDSMPFDLALNIDEVDLKKLKMDSPLKTEEINGKFYLTTIANGRIADISNMQAKGTLAIREGFLTEFKIFKGLLGALNEALRLGQVMITDVEANFVLLNQKISTDNLRLKSPTIVLLGQGWVNFNQDCDLTMGVDMSSGLVPPIAEEVLRTLSIHIYGKVSDPKFDKKISVPQVINSILKTLF